MVAGHREARRKAILESASVQGAKEPEKLDWNLFLKTGVLDQTIGGADKVTRPPEVEEMLRRKLEAITANGGTFNLERMKDAERR